MDEVFGKLSPLDSVLKLEQIMRTCRSNSDQIEWILIQIGDLCLNRKVAPGEFQPSFLFGGKGQQKGKLVLFQLVAHVIDSKS